MQTQSNYLYSILDFLQTFFICRYCGNSHQFLCIHPSFAASQRNRFALSIVCVEMKTLLNDWKVWQNHNYFSAKVHGKYNPYPILAAVEWVCVCVGACALWTHRLYLQVLPVMLAVGVWNQLEQFSNFLFFENVENDNRNNRVRYECVCRMMMRHAGRQ